MLVFGWGATGLWRPQALSGRGQRASSPLGGGFRSLSTQEGRDKGEEEEEEGKEAKGGDSEEVCGIDGGGGARGLSLQGGEGSFFAACQASI